MLWGLQRMDKVTAEQLMVEVGWYRICFTEDCISNTTTPQHGGEFCAAYQGGSGAPGFQ